MFEALRTSIVTPLAERWLQTSRSSWRTLPVPSGSPFARADGPDPDRILLFGSGISMGYGMASHEFALAGQLARQVAGITLRGVQIDVVTGEQLTLDSGLKNLTVSRLRELDVVIATPGNLEKMLLMPPSVWSERLGHLLDHFATHAPASLRVLFIGVPEMSQVVRMPKLLGYLTDRSARALNRALENSCSTRPYAQFVQFHPTEHSGREGTGRTYEHWASLIAPSVAAALDEHQRVGIAR